MFYIVDCKAKLFLISVYHVGFTGEFKCISHLINCEMDHKIRLYLRWYYIVMERPLSSETTVLNILCIPVGAACMLIFDIRLHRRRIWGSSTVCF